MIRYIEKVCICHNELEENCDFIKTLKDLNAYRFAAALLEEREVPTETPP